MLLLLSLLGASNAFAQGSPAAPVVEFGPNALTISRIAPGGRVAVFGVGLMPNGYESTVSRWMDVLQDDDRDGVIHYDLANPLVRKSIWIVVSLPDRLFTISGPAGYPPHAANVRSSHFRGNAPDVVDEFVHDRSFVDLFYVSPSGDCWTLEARDGYDTDSDRRVNGSVDASLVSFKPLKNANANPKAFAPGGLLFGIDFSRMDVFAIRIDANVLKGRQ
jgi:hypothetical protein